MTDTTIREDDCLEAKKETVGRPRRESSRSDQAVQQMRNALTIRITKIANGFTVTETGSGDIFFYYNLQLCYAHINKFFEKSGKPAQ